MSENSGYRGYYADCYVLSDNRTTEFVREFLEEFLPQRKESADEYFVPMYSNNPKRRFNEATKLIDYLCLNSSFENTIYWSNSSKSEPKGAMCFFTDDGKIIFGLYCNTKYENTEIEDHILTKMKKFIGSEVGLITYEEPAPHNSKEFHRMVYERST